MTLRHGQEISQKCFMQFIATRPHPFRQCIPGGPTGNRSEEDYLAAIPTNVSLLLCFIIHQVMNIILKEMETDEEIKGKAYVHWKSWPDNLIVAKDNGDMGTYLLSSHRVGIIQGLAVIS